MKTQAFDWDDLKYFLAVVRSGTLRGGADRINANHTTVSRRLGLLEENVGSRLFDRTKTGFVLTQLGEELLPYAERVEEEIVAASRVVVGRDALPSGTILLSLPHALSMTSIMDDFAAFSRQYPEIDLDICFTNVVADLTRREADVSIRVANDVMDDVVGRKLVPLSAAVYCSPDYAERMEDNGGEGLTFLGWDEPEGETRPGWIKDGFYPKATLRHRVMEIVPHLALAAAGMGLTHLACCLGDRHPGLVRAPFQKPVAHRSLWLLLHRDLKKTARVRLFVDFLAERIRLRKSEFWAGMD